MAALHFKQLRGVPSLPIILINPSDFATAVATYVYYDGSFWLKSGGTVDTNTDNNPKYTAVQYNASGSFHYDRLYAGYAQFGWWRNSSGNAWQQLKYAINHQAGAKIQVEDGTYDFTENAFSSGNFELRGNITDPSRVTFRTTSAQTMIINGWFWYDGVTDGQRFDNILIHGIRFVQNSTATTNSSRGPVVFEGASQNNITVRRCEYVQQSTTAITNFFFLKSGANLKTQNIVFEDNRSVNTTTKGRMMFEAINQDHPNNDKGQGYNIKIRKNYIDGFDYGFSVAGNYNGVVVDDNDVGSCTSYGVEFAGSNTNATLSNTRFFGTHNVLWASNYHGETNGSSGDYPIPAGSGQHYINNRTLGYVPGIVEIRGAGDMVFNGNQLNISGGVYLRRNSLGGVVSGEMKHNRIITNATAGNMSNKAVLYLAGATNIRALNNTFERTSADTVPLVQAVKSPDETYGTGSVQATGVSSTGSIFEGNTMIAAVTPTSYFSAPDPNSITILRNLTASGSTAI